MTFQQHEVQEKLGVTLGGIVAPMAIECRRNCKDSSAAVRINNAFCRSMNWEMKDELLAKESRSDEVY